MLDLPLIFWVCVLVVDHIDNAPLPLRESTGTVFACVTVEVNRQSGSSITEVVLLRITATFLAAAVNLEELESVRALQKTWMTCRLLLMIIEAAQCYAHQNRSARKNCVSNMLPRIREDEH